MQKEIDYELRNRENFKNVNIAVIVLYSRAIGKHAVKIKQNY